MGTVGPDNSDFCSFRILSIALQPIDGPTDGTSSSPGPVFLAGDLFGLVDDGTCDLGGLFPSPRIGGQLLCRIAADMAQEGRHGDTLAHREVCHQPARLLLGRSLQWREQQVSVVLEGENAFDDPVIVAALVR